MSLYVCDNIFSAKMFELRLKSKHLSMREIFCRSAIEITLLPHQSSVRQIFAYNSCKQRTRK